MGDYKNFFFQEDKNVPKDMKEYQQPPVHKLRMICGNSSLDISFSIGGEACKVTTGRDRTCPFHLWTASPPDRGRTRRFSDRVSGFPQGHQMRLKNERRFRCRSAAISLTARGEHSSAIVRAIVRYTPAKTRILLF